MAWEISHTPEAWENARNNLEYLWNRKQIIDALADDAFEAQEEAGFETGPDAADVLRDLLSDTPQDLLIDMAMSSISLHNTCTNGGHSFYIDRQGLHTVSCGVDWHEALDDDNDFWGEDDFWVEAE